MNKLYDFITKYRKLILSFCCVLVVVSTILTALMVVNNKVNSDMMEYLPQDSETMKGLTFLKDKFNINGDAMYVIEGDDYDEELPALIEKFKEVDGVTQLIWAGLLDNLEDEIPDIEIGGVNIKDILTIDTTTMMSFLKQPIEGTDKFNYVVIMMVDYSPASAEAFAALSTMSDLLTESGRVFAKGGMTATSQIVMDETLGEIWKYMIVAILLVILILFLTSGSYIEPLILIITMGVAIIVNMGTNYIFPSISIISFAASSVLQLGVAMDYAIFFMHIYKEKRKEFNPIEATKKSLPLTMVTILASAFTTIGGFLALFFMKFTIGADIGMVIAKGVFLSLLTVIFVQPCLSICLDKWIGKTKHKEATLNYEPIARFTIKHRKPILIIAMLLVIPAVIGQSMVQYSYFNLYEPAKNPTTQEKLASELTNQTIIAVPLDTKNYLTHQNFVKELKEIEKVQSVMGIFEATNMPAVMLKLALPVLVESNEMMSSFCRLIEIDGEKQWYTLYTVNIKGSCEDEAAFECYEKMVELSNKYFDNSYQIGLLTGVNDMAKITPNDFLWVSIISIAAILIILILLMKSVSKGALMILLIELGIWLNLSLNAITGSSLNFMVYILISSVQLGCTVDYAILMVNKFEEAKRQFSDYREACIHAVKTSLPAIVTSAAIICSVCLSVYFVSSNLIVKEMCFVLARGGFISFLLVMFVLPGILMFFKNSKPLKIRKSKKQLAVESLGNNPKVEAIDQNKLDG